ncbi:MAG: hypothetical protein M3014_04715 [Chloroflexota bacterium]|nr:hypothetical protein [Chloroflexota bacterium]
MGAAFVGVMAGTGGLIGAIGGMVLTLLSYTVLGLGAGLAEFVPAGIGAGTLFAAGLAVVLIMRQAPALSLPHRAPSNIRENN